jgi:hypothetical protein
MKANGLREEPIFSIAVSSAFPYGNGKRRRLSGHDGKLNQTPKMTPYKHPFIQVPITIKPKPEPGLVILEKIP